MNAALSSPAFTPSLPASATKPLWAAVGVLSVCMLAMGATLVHVNKRPEPLAQAALPFSSALAMNSAATSSGMITEEKLIEKPAVGGAKSAQNAPKLIAKQAAPAVAKTPATSPAPTNSPVIVAQAPSTTPASEASAGTAPVVVAQLPAKPACASCGTIEAVTPITKEGEGSGVGVIAGSVLGGVVGNQVGKGTGRAATTVLGAIGGGWAGNAIEKNMKKTTAYSVRVRMEDGTSRTVEQSSAPTVGSKVTLDGNTIRPA